MVINVQGKNPTCSHLQINWCKFFAYIIFGQYLVDTMFDRPTMHDIMLACSVQYKGAVWLCLIYRISQFATRFCYIAWKKKSILRIMSAYSKTFTNNSLPLSPSLLINANKCACRKLRTRHNLSCEFDYASNYDGQKPDGILQPIKIPHDLDIYLCISFFSLLHKIKQ